MSVCEREKETLEDYGEVRKNKEQTETDSPGICRSPT